MKTRGLICAGGEATRLGELTRVTNKHLLPVGRWPMILYPLRLLQLAGIREVLVVTGKAHAGQMIDLLGDGRMTVRGSEEPLLDLDLTYKVQTEAGGIAQVVGMARDFAAGEKLVVVLDRDSGETFTEDVGDENPVAIYVPGRHAHGFEALTDLLFLYHVTEEYDPADPDEHGVPWNDPRVAALWSTRSPILSKRDRAVAL